MNATVVIPVFNAWEYTERCLDSLIPTLRTGDRVVVVDDGSTDRTLVNLTPYLSPALSVLCRDENSGFATACNEGAKFARFEQPDALVFLNNDTLVYGDWLDELTEPLRNDWVGAVGPVSNFVSGFQLYGKQVWRVEDRADLPPIVEKITSEAKGSYRTAPYLVGFCLAIRTKTFFSVGRFDERYEVGGYEDNDLCQTLTKDGKSILVAPGCFVYHEGHATFEANGLDFMEFQEQNQHRYDEKWAS